MTTNENIVKNGDVLLSATNPAAPVEGACDPRFQAVLDAFKKNFAGRGEVGAAVCVYLDGQKVVDLWGGFSDQARTTAWREDTIVCMMSVTKGMLALCVHTLVEDGKLDLAEKVATYWPEFAQAGKGDITVQQLVSHHAGLIYADLAPDQSLLNWDVMVDALARQKPEWEPGTQGAYHSSTYGHLLGELVRRVSGKTFPQILVERFTGPLGMDYHVGLSEERQRRVADVIVNPDSVTASSVARPETKLGRAWRVRPTPPQGHYYNWKPVREAEIGSSNGHGNARAVARLYAALARGGEIAGIRVLKEDTIRTIRQEQWRGLCGMTDRIFGMGVGLFLNTPDYFPIGPNPNSFGHPGAGGAVGFADPDLKLSFSYCANYMCSGAALGDRCDALIQALYTCIGAGAAH
jgi:CubicO group peptidase (beta-lactamase class C family)